MKKYELLSSSEVETMAIAERLAALLKSGCVIALEGDLGVGKTAFTKGLAKGLGISERIKSPTFVIVKEYEGRLPLFHFDVYRVADGFEDLGYEEYFFGDGVCVVEWAHLIEGQLPVERLTIEIFYVGEDLRRFVLKPVGACYEAICEAVVV